MIELSQITVLIGAELLVGLLLLSGFLIFLGIRRKSRIRRVARQLVDRIQRDKGPHSERLKHYLAEHFGYGEEALEQRVQDLVQAEMLLYQNIINGHLNQDIQALQQTDVDVENLVSAYQRLQPSQVAEGGGQASGPPVAARPGESEEIQRLRDENERLSAELTVTMDTMGRMLNEYSTMFGVGTESLVDEQGVPGMFEGGGKGESQEVAQDSGQPVEADAVEPPGPAQQQAAGVEQGSSAQEGHLEAAPAQEGGAVEEGEALAVVEESLMEGLEDIEIGIEEPTTETQGKGGDDALAEEWGRLLDEDAEELSPEAAVEDAPVVTEAAPGEPLADPQGGVADASQERPQQSGDQLTGTAEGAETKGDALADEWAQLLAEDEQSDGGEEAVATAETRT